jgi:predicted RNase H-like HicB family nuclease
LTTEDFVVRYMAIVDGRPGIFGVVVPDLPGCASGGTTVAAALRNAVGAISLWTDDARRDGAKIPKPRSPKKLGADPAIVELLAHGGILVRLPKMV